MSNFFQDDGLPCEGRKICLATTAYENPAAAYTFAIQKTREAMHKAGFPTAYYLLSGNCHVDDARNSIVQEFLLSDCTDLVFLDADVVWEPSELIKLCQYDADIVGGVYPYRRDDEQSKESMPVLMFPGSYEANGDGLVEVAGLPTGFMRIRRHVIERLAEKADKFWKRNDRRSPVPILFERAFIEGTRLGGDLNFCRKWIAEGGAVYAATDLHLGHVAKSIVYDSLGASMRRKYDTTIPHLVDKIRKGEFTPTLFAEARRYVGNHWGAQEEVLMLCAILGRKSQGPILETGSGLSSVVLGASTKNRVVCLEHDPRWCQETERLLSLAQLDNVEIVDCAIEDGWYKTPDLPEFTLALNDGPPRMLGDRKQFFDGFGYIPTVICDDADEKGYGDWLVNWGREHGRKVDFIERAALLRAE